MGATHESGAGSAPKKKATRRAKAKPVETEAALEDAAAAVPETEPIPEPPPEPPPRKGGSPGKARQAARAVSTLGELAERYLHHLEAEGRSHGTLFSYGIELRTACKELGTDTAIASLTPEQVLAYFNSPRVTQLKSGKPKAKPSIDKTRRVMRLALVWAVEQGWIERAPLPEAQ